MAKFIIENEHDIEILESTGVPIESINALHNDLREYGEQTMEILVDGAYFWWENTTVNRVKAKIICWFSGGVTSAVAW